ncbi:MAG: WD40 repeat domain-containing protein [Gemmataceae bacterium]
MGRTHGDVTGLAFAADGKRLATARITTRRYGWQNCLPAGSPWRCAEHAGGVLSVAFGPDGHWIASGDDTTVRHRPGAVGVKSTRPMTQGEGGPTAVLNNYPAVLREPARPGTMAEFSGARLAWRSAPPPGLYVARQRLAEAATRAPASATS